MFSRFTLRSATASAGLAVASSIVIACTPPQTGDNTKNYDASGSKNATPICLFTDIDGTFVDYHDKAAVTENLSQFFKYWEDHERPLGSILVYNTARSIKNYEVLPVDFPGLLPPDVLITGEGTEIRWLTSPSSSPASSHGHDENFFEFAVDSCWAKRIRAHWWDSGLREKVRSALDAVDELCIENLNIPENALNDQGEARHAITIHGGPESEQRALNLLKTLLEKLNGHGDHQDKNVTPTQAVELAVFPAWGVDPKPHIITALPSCAGKGKAAQFVAKRLGFSEEQCLCAGDTLGDMALLQDAGDMAFIAVANAQDSLKNAVADARMAVDADCVDCVDCVFPCVVSGAGAAGVLEGTRMFRRCLN